MKKLTRRFYAQTLKTDHYGETYYGRSPYETLRFWRGKLAEEVLCHIPLMVFVGILLYASQL